MYLFLSSISSFLNIMETIACFSSPVQSKVLKKNEPISQLHCNDVLNRTLSLSEKFRKDLIAVHKEFKMANYGEMKMAQHLDKVENERPIFTTLT